MITRYYVIADTGKRRRRVYMNRATGTPRWKRSKDTSGSFTSLAVKKYLIPWAKKRGYKLTLRRAVRWPHLVLDTDTAWPSEELCNKLEKLGRKLDRKLFIREGLRTRQRQQELYDQGVIIHGYPNVLNYVAAPGTSRHETGTAADVGVITSTSGRLGVNLAQYPGARVAAEGIGLFFPMSYEPWHVEAR